jgi:predicted transcriptional regulator
MIAKQLVTDTIIPLKRSDTGDFAISQMEELRCSHLPIVDGVDFWGVISDTEILAQQEPDQEVGRYKQSLLNAYISENQHIFEVIKVFSTLHLTMLPVLNEKNQYVGAICLSTLVDHLAEMAALHNPGGIIILEINDKDYSLTEIAQIVESNDAKILSLYITSFPDSTKLEVTIKINRIDIGPVLQTFFRFNYLVSASWSQEDAYSEGLQDRFDALMNYLSI